MILSMTGFGKASSNMPNKKINVEIKSVNSKQLDLSFRMSSRYREKEHELRQIFARDLERGKVDVSISVEHNAEVAPLIINQELAMHYYKEIKTLGEMIGDEKQVDYLRIVLKMPDVMKGDSSELDSEEWDAVRRCVEEAVRECVQFRRDEGGALMKDISNRISLILKYLGEVDNFEHKRIGRIKDRITNNIHELFPNIKLDETRLEQEMIFYIEKLDITEEKVRLRKHCEYFMEALNSDENTGKKLNFISQEIGREINTLGSKANDYEMQKLVVMMKDELEKIKEQILNIL